MFSVRILAASFKRKISPSLAPMDGSDEEVPHDVECMFLKSNNVTCDVTRWVLDVFWSDVFGAEDHWDNSAPPAPYLGPEASCELGPFDFFA